MPEFVGEVQLRNLRRVFRDGTSFVVEADAPDQRTHTQRVDDAVVNALGRMFAGRTVTVREAADAVAMERDLDLPFSRGYKLDFFVQDALIALCASGRADANKVSRTYHYTIRG
ncbi:MAG: hypothetical protein AB7H88_11775 [Vicinamibacterales bacterium]